MKRFIPVIGIILTILFYLPLLKANSVIVITDSGHRGATSTPTQTPNAYCHSYVSSADGSSFWAGAGCNGTATPIPLNSPVVVFQGGQPLHYLSGSPVPSPNACTPAGNGPAASSTGGNGGATDDTPCMVKAMNAGDVQVRAPAVAGGYYLLFSQAGGTSHISFPAGRNIRGCTDPNGDCSSTTANYNPQGGTVAFGDEGDCDYGYFGFQQSSPSYGGSFYGLQWRGINYNAMNTCTVDLTGTRPTQSWITIGGQGTGGVIVAVNDFNGIAGNSGEINFTDSQTTYSPEETSSIVEWDWFTNSLVNSVEFIRGTNNLIQWISITGVASHHDGTGWYGSDMLNNEPSGASSSLSNGTVSCTGLLGGVSGTMNTVDNCNLFRNIDYIINPGSQSITNQIFGISNSESGNYPGFNYSGNFQINTHQASTSSNASSVVMMEGHTTGGQGGIYFNNTCASADFCSIVGAPSANLPTPAASCTNPITGWCSNQ